LNRRDVLTGMALSATMLMTRQGLAAEASPALWDLGDLYPDTRAWEASAVSLQTRISGLATFATTSSQSSQRLGEALAAVSQARRDSQRLSTYARLAASADLRDVAAQQRRARADGLAGTLDASTAWLDPAVRALGRETIDAWLAADPTLARFRHPLDEILRLTPHALPAAEVEAFASGSGLFDGPESSYNQLVSADMPHPTITLSTGEQVLLDDGGYTKVRAMPARADRKLAFDRFWASYGAYRNTMGTLLSTQVAADNMLARLGHYDSALDAALGSVATPRTVFTTLIAEARAGIPIFQRYLKLRQRALRQPDLHYYDIYAPLGRTNRMFASDTARATMLESVRPLGQDYVARLTKASAARWIDLTSRPGKNAGSFTDPDAYDVHPYILLNYTPDYHGLTTYVHEWGHAMHGVLANAAQPFETAHYETMVAEIASTCNEQLLAHHLLETASDKHEKIYYLGQLLELLRLNIFREPMLSEFEHAMHEQAAAGMPISGAGMSEAYLKLLRDYHSPAMRIDPAYAMEWSFIPQFYTAYYSFQYATSITASSYFSQAILAGDERARRHYLAMLSAGGSGYAYDLVFNGGVDLASPKPYRELMRRFDGLLDQLEALLA